MLLLLYPLTQATGSNAAATASLATLGLTAPAGVASAYVDALATGALTGISLVAPLAAAVGEYSAPPADRFNYGAAYNAKNLSHSMADPAVARAYLRTRRRRPW